jgi:hypothetical protein
MKNGPGLSMKIMEIFQPGSVGKIVKAEQDSKER